jgi:prefoldin subunit 5
MIAANIDLLEDGLAALEARIRETRRLLGRLRDLETLNREVPVLGPGARDQIARALDGRAQAIAQEYDQIERIYNAEESLER